MLQIDITRTALENMLDLINSASSGPVYTLDDFQITSVQSITKGPEDQYDNNAIVYLQGIGNYVGTASMKYHRLDLAQTTTGTPYTASFIYDSQSEQPEDFRLRVSYALEFALDAVNFPFINLAAGETGVITVTPKDGDANYLYTGSRDVTVMAVNGMTSGV